MLIPNFTGPLDERMTRLNGLLEGKDGLRIVGSSFGGLMAALFAIDNEPRVERLILLAPAINLVEFIPRHGRAISVPVWIFHGRDDEVIPIEDVRRVAQEVFTDLRFNEVDDDHSLHRTFSTLGWESLLGVN